MPPSGCFSVLLSFHSLETPLGLWVFILLFSRTNVLLLPKKLSVVITCLSSEITLLPFICPVEERIEVLLLR